MKTTKANSLYRLVILLLLAAVIVCIVAFAAEGKQMTPTPQTPGNTTPETPKSDTISGTPDEPQKPTDPEPETPKFYHYLTGEEIPGERACLMPIAYVTDAAGALYGIGNSPLTFEFPTEDGATRYLIYQDGDSELGKIGSLTHSRGYIDRVTDTFGGLLVHTGCDDAVSYRHPDVTSRTLDLSRTQGCSYTEGGGKVYTNSYLIRSALENGGYRTAFVTAPTLPFTFSEVGKSAVAGSQRAQRVTLPYAQDNTTVLTYNETTGRYTLSKGGSDVSELLNNRTVSYKNVFVLFADATTYERSDLTQTVLDTESGGTGYYISEGSLTRLTWEYVDGKLIFRDNAGQTLTVNRGNSYISFFKASRKANVKFG